MTQNFYVLQLPDPDQSPARSLVNGDDTYVVCANSTADAQALVANVGGRVWNNASLVSPVALAAASNMNGFSFRVQIYDASANLVADLLSYAGGQAVGTASATGVLTATGNFNNGDTVTIGSRVYTLQSALTNTDGHVHIGANLQASLLNLANAINNTGGGTPGTDYYVTQADPNVSAVSTSTTLTATALVAGSAANSVATLYTPSGTSEAAWGHATLTGGTSATDTVSSLATSMASLINKAGIGISGASYNTGTDLLTIAAASDNKGDHTVAVSFYPPSGNRAQINANDDNPNNTGDYEQDFWQYNSNLSEGGVSVQLGFPIPGYVGTITQGGSAGSAVTAQLVADSYTVPTVLVAARAQE